MLHGIHLEISEIVALYPQCTILLFQNQAWQVFAIDGTKTVIKTGKNCSGKNRFLPPKTAKMIKTDF